MLQRLAIYMVFGLACFGKCITYGSEARLTGKLSLRDEAGYNQYIFLQLQSPICTAANSGQGSEDQPPHSNVREIQAGVSGGDDTDTPLWETLTELVGHPVSIKGVVFSAQTGYHRTDVQLAVHAIRPLTSAGFRALRKRVPEAVPNEIPAYDVEVHAAARLSIKAHDIATNALLVPPSLYVSHHMTGGEVLYVNCRPGYTRTLSSSSEKGGLGCDDGDEPFCGTSAFPQSPVLIKFRCIKNQKSEAAR